MKTMTLTEARNQLLKVAEEMERRPDQVVGIVKRGKKVMTLLSTEVYEALVETLEIVAVSLTPIKAPTFERPVMLPPTRPMLLMVPG